VIGYGADVSIMKLICYEVIDPEFEIDTKEDVTAE
jgi:hypothetical protein